MTLLSAKEVAHLENTTERTIQRKIKGGHYEYTQVEGGRGRGGIQCKITLESLPQSAQDRYNEQKAGNIPKKNYSSILHYTGKQRENADFKALVVTQYWQSKQSPDDFVATYNAENPKSLISKHQLMRWQGKYKKNKDVADLIDIRGEHRRGITSISQEAWDCFYSWYMTQQKRSIQLCWEKTRDEYPDIPSVSTFERRVKAIPEYIKIRYREGEKAFNDNLPSMIRSRADIFSNCIWFGDHHLSDVWVINKAGKLVRLWMTALFDARSNKVMGILARNADPDATAIKLCFKKAVEVHGIVCKEFYFDRGRDFKSKSFSNEWPLSLVNQLGINVIYATPYHAQAKTVERFFGTLEDRFGKLFPTYLGSDAKKRPEIMRQYKREEILKIAPHMDDFIKLLEDYIDEYNNTPSRGIDMDGKCPEQVYHENLVEKTVLHDPNILRILCGTFNERTVRENGIQMLNNYFWHELLIPYKGKKVIVSYYPDNIDVINVFDTDMRAICVAYAKIKTPFRDTTEEEYKAAAKEKKKVREFVNQHKPLMNKDIHSIIEKKQAEEMDYSGEANPRTITRINPQITQNQAILKSTEKGGRRQRVDNEHSDMIAVLSQAYQLQKIGG